MVKLKLTLKSGRPSTVYASNGKSYKLKPGSNTLELEYEDYLALAKSLGIKPVENKKKEEPKPAPHKEDPKPAEPEKVEEPIKEEAPVDEPAKEEPAKESEKVEDIKEETPVEEPVEDKKEEVDYTTWTASQLKAEYKRITGKTCKLKKDEIIAFLQEHNNNVE